MIICRKINGTDLNVGGKLEAEVVEVRVGTGALFESDYYAVSDNFVLHANSNSSYAGYLSGLSVGDTVGITVEETVEASKEIMENANSVITNVGWLVKDGVDMTDYYSTIGEHSVSGTYARWTAFGQKPDGTFVFFTSDGGSTGDTSQSLTLKDVAASMMQLGCTNVIRMDSGGTWNLHVAFSPISGTDNAYVITSISDGTGGGNGSALAIPSGGFVYTLNLGNDWPTIYASRERKLKITTQLINEVGPYLDYYYIGVDDSHPNETLQSNEIRYFNKLIADNCMTDNVLLFSGADELGILGIGAVASNKYSDDKTPVNVTYGITDTSVLGSTDDYPNRYAFISSCDGDTLANGTVAVNTVNNVGSLVIALGSVQSFDIARISYGVKA